MKAVRSASEHMPPNKLRDHVVRALEDLKGREIVALDVSRATSVTDYMVIASGTSNTHVKALVDNLLESSHANGIPSIGVEGRETMEWERLWSEVPRAESTVTAT
jgi:ribosome-associated protein